MNAYEGLLAQDYDYWTQVEDGVNTMEIPFGLIQSVALVDEENLFFSSFEPIDTELFATAAKVVCHRALPKPELILRLEAQELPDYFNDRLTVSRRRDDKARKSMIPASLMTLPLEMPFALIAVVTMSSLPPILLSTLRSSDYSPTTTDSKDAIFATFYKSQTTSSTWTLTCVDSAIKTLRLPTMY